MLRKLVLLVLLVALPLTPAYAKGGETRVKGSCGKGARAELRVKADDGQLEVRFRVTGRRSGEAWRVTVTQERRLVYRATVRTGSGGLDVRRKLRDLEGSDTITARATGPNGLTCNATANLWA